MASLEYTVNTRFTSDTVGLEAASASQRELAATGREAAVSQKLVEQANRETAVSYDQLSAKGRRALRSFERLEGQLDDNARATHQYRRAQRELDGALRRGFISQRRHVELLKTAEQQYRRTTSAMGAFFRRFRGDIVALGAASVLSIGSGIASAGDLEQQLLGQLEVALRSREAAAVELARLQDFAATTPVQVDEITDAFAKLSVRGLQPTIDELRVFGDIAGASRKTLDQFVEAALDAAVGEGERLKEFGIKMRTTGEEVTLTFADMSLKVPKDAESITAALLEIGRTNFAGGLALQAETLSGKWSTLSDATNQLGATLYRSGIGDLLKGITDALTDTINATNRWLTRHDDLESSLDRLGKRWKDYGDDVSAAAQVVADNLDSLSLDQLEAQRRQLIVEIAKVRDNLRDGLALGDFESTPYLDQLEQALARVRAEEVALRQQTAEGNATRRESAEAIDQQTQAFDELEKQQASRRQDFERNSEAEIEVLRRLTEAAQVPGATLESLDRLEEQLRTLQGLGIPIDSGGEGAERVRQLTNDVANLTTQLASLRGEIESIETVDVVAAPGTGPGFSTANDETEAAYPNGLGPDEDLDQRIAQAQAELDAMSASVSATLRDGLIGALESAAAAGRIAFEDVFNALRGQLGNLFEMAALRSVTLTGDADVDAAATEAALEQAKTTAAAVSGVLGAWYAVYDIVDGWVEQGQWERANTGAVRLQQFLTGDLAADLQRSGSAVSRLLQQTGDAAADTIEDILFGFDATLERLSGLVELRVNEGNYEVAVGSFVQSFGSAAQEAFDYFVIQALKLAEIDGAPDEVQRTLSTTRATSLDALERELQIAQQIHQLPWDDTERSIYSIEQSMRDLFRFAEEKLLAAQSFENIGASAARDLLDLYNSITGQGLSPEEQFGRDSSTFNRLRAELIAQAEAEIASLIEQIANLPGVAESAGVDLETLREGVSAGFTGILDQTAGAIDGITTLLDGLSRNMLNAAGLSDVALQQLQGRLAGLQAFLDALPPAISDTDFRPPGSGQGRQRRETREDFAADLERLRALEAGVSEITLALEDEANTWAEQAERFRRAGVAQALIDEWLALQEGLSNREFFDGITDRGQRLGESSFQTSIRELREAQAAEIEQAELRGATMEQLAAIEAVHRGELEALIEARERELQQYTDLAAGISPWQRGLLDLDDFFEQQRADQLALIEIQHGLADSAGTLAEALANLDAAQQAAAEGLYTDLLQRLEAAGVVIPGFGRTMLDLEFAMLRADLAAAAARDGFLEWLQAQGLSLDDLFAGIDDAYQQAIANLENPPAAPTFDRPGLGDGGRSTIDAGTERALDAVVSALEDLRGSDPTRTEPERIADLELRYRQALDAALAGDTDAAAEAARLALELRNAMEANGTATGAFLALIPRLDNDLTGLQGLLESQLSDHDIQLDQLGVLRDIRDRLDPAAVVGDRSATTGTIGSRRPGLDLPSIALGPVTPRASAPRTATGGEQVERLLAQAVDLLSQGNRQRGAGQKQAERGTDRLARALEDGGVKGSRPDGPLRIAARDDEHGGRGPWGKS